MSTTAVKKAAKSATLASMVAKPAEAPAVTPEPVVEAFDWNTLPPAEVVVYSRNAPSIDFEAVTPDFIKDRVKNAYSKTLEALAAGSKNPVWNRQECGSPERVAEFMKLAKRYAGYLGYTLRGKEASDSKTVAAYCVKPKETRAKKA